MWKRKQKYLKENKNEVEIKIFYEFADLVSLLAHILMTLKNFHIEFCSEFDDKFTIFFAVLVAVGVQTRLDTCEYIFFNLTKIQ